jgi:hypothetical protein
VLRVVRVVDFAVAFVGRVVFADVFFFGFGAMGSTVCVVVSVLSDARDPSDGESSGSDDATAPAERWA